MRVMAHWQQNSYSSHFRVRMPQPLSTAGLNVAHVAYRLRCSNLDTNKPLRASLLTMSVGQEPCVQL